MLHGAAKLRWVQALGTGVDNLIDLPSLSPDVVITNIRGIHGAPVSEAALMINVPAADRAALTAITTKAYKAKGYVDISVAGQTWAIPEAMAPLTQGQFEISLPSKNLALRLQRLLDPSS